ncbi:phospholipid scramblase 1-like [Ruditapes philippinarum]|uniref:phospholipid scramblase 1-like n=1 Tax=Ruditapes philippinarum TaxID=129788 RepID=UPI00295A62D6|nr:phospholipid scramblase 1-like [Ruditapes philippinarum]
MSQEQYPPTAVLPGHVQQVQYGVPPAGQYGVQPSVPIPPAANLWMPKPEASLGCPPGLEYLSIVEELMFRQFMDIAPGRMGMPTVANSWYKIENYMGQQIYFVTEETDMSGVCLPGQRGYTIHISDNVGSEVMRISRKPIFCSCCPCCGCCDHLIEVEAPVGNIIGYLKSRKNFMRPVFVITDASDEDLFSITLPMCATSSPMSQQQFTINSAEDQSDVATVTKQWGRMDFYYRQKDFNLKFPLDLDVRSKALLMASIFVIDAIFYPQHQMVQQRRRGRRM